jgi:hypothetical protein
MKRSLGPIRLPMSERQLHYWAQARFSELIAEGACIVGAIEQVVFETRTLVSGCA